MSSPLELCVDCEGKRKFVGANVAMPIVHAASKKERFPPSCFTEADVLEMLAATGSGTKQAIERTVLERIAAYRLGG